MKMKRREEKRQKSRSVHGGDEVSRKTLEVRCAFHPDVQASAVKSGLWCGKSPVSVGPGPHVNREGTRHAAMPAVGATLLGTQ